MKKVKLRLPKFRAPKMFRKNEKLFWSIVVIVTAVIIGIVAWQLSSGNGSSPNNRAPNNVLPVALNDAPTDDPIEIVISPVNNSVTGVMVEYRIVRPGDEPIFYLHIPIQVRTTTDIEVPLSRLNNLWNYIVRISFAKIDSLQDHAQTSSYIDSSICNLKRDDI